MLGNIRVILPGPGRFRSKTGMDKKGNSSQGPEQSPQFTLFGKRMEMEDSERPAPHNAAPKVYLRPDDEDAEERRTFWLVAGTAALIFGGVLLGVGVQYFRSRTAAPAPPAVQRPAEAQPAAPAPASQPKPTEPPAPAGAPAPSPTAAAPATSAPAPVPPAVPPAQKALVAPAAPATESRREAQKAEDRASSAAVPAADGGAAPRVTRKTRASARRVPQPDPYIERLRKELEQYEREKTQGKYREFPR